MLVDIRLENKKPIVRRIRVCTAWQWHHNGVGHGAKPLSLQSQLTNRLTNQRKLLTNQPFNQTKLPTRSLTEYLGYLSLFQYSTTW